MADEGAFDLEGADAVAGGLDDVVGAADEVVIALLIRPDHVAGVVHAVAEGVARLFRVLVIAHEQAAGTALGNVDAQFALLAALHVAPGGVHHADVVVRAGNARGTGDRLHPLVGDEQRRRLALAEGLVDLYAGEAVELVVDLRVERLAGAGGPLKGGKIVAAEILLDEKAVDGRRRAEAGDMVLGQHGKHLLGVEAVEIVDEVDRAGDPLAVELAPAALGPAGIGGGDVDALVGEVVPEGAGDEVADAVAEIVRQHLGHAGGAGGEVDEHHVFRRGVVAAVHGVRRLGEQAIKVLKALVRAAQRGGDAQVRALFLRSAHVGEQFFLAHADERAGVGGVYAVGDVLFLQLVRGGDLDGADAHQPQRAQPVFIAALEHQKHRLALLHTQRAQGVGRLDREAGKLGEGEDALLARVVRPDHRHLIGGEAGVFVDDVAGEVEVFRGGIAVIGKEILAVLIIGSSEARQQIHNCLRIWPTGSPSQETRTSCPHMPAWRGDGSSRNRRNRPR